MLLLVRPEAGSSESQIVEPSVEPVRVVQRAGSEVDQAAWYAYRAASRQEAGVMPDPKRDRSHAIRLQ
jgi:hypothetical protein